MVLSAQCTDKRVNMVTPELFLRYPTPEKLGAAPVEDILELIHSVSYPNSKAKHLQAMAAKIVSDFGGEVPGTVDELMTLPGVGRKTANVVASIVFDEPVIAVDTHVGRVARRTGLSSHNEPDKVEEDLMKVVPKKYLRDGHHYLLLLGRYICRAQKPLCSKCPVAKWCPSCQ